VCSDQGATQILFTAAAVQQQRQNLARLEKDLKGLNVITTRMYSDWEPN
jgi:hypothetical protein